MRVRRVPCLAVVCRTAAVFFMSCHCGLCCVCVFVLLCHSADSFGTSQMLRMEFVGKRKRRPRLGTRARLDFILFFILSLSCLVAALVCPAAVSRVCLFFFSLCKWLAVFCQWLKQHRGQGWSVDVRGVFFTVARGGLWWFCVAQRVAVPVFLQTHVRQYCRFVVDGGNTDVKLKGGIEAVQQKRRSTSAWNACTEGKFRTRSC